MPLGHRQPPSISTRDVQEYLHRQSRLCDSRIEDAYMRLSSRYGESRPPYPAAIKRRALSSSSISLPTRKYVVLDNVTRPSSAQERAPPDGRLTERPRGILKKTQSPVGSSGLARKGSSESPDQWFQRIMGVKMLSPLDLCELFSYGDARKHPLVPLCHVCEVLFDLDPESANGADPVTDQMEEFLYQFATGKSGEIMVNIKEALRSLDIWQSRAVSAGPRVVPPKLASDSQSKAVVLESKNRKLMGVISSLQDANLRLSRQLDSAKCMLSPKPDEPLPPTLSPRSRAAMKPSSVDVSPVKFKVTATAKAPSVSQSSLQKPSRTRLQVINLHEQELVKIASKLQLTGVKRLEEALIEGDPDASGFVKLKQLCWLLAHQFQLTITETTLIEVCMGMNFNSHAQLDYKEFVDVLLDILVYALPDIRESAKRKSLVRLDHYLQSGFSPGREDVRQLLDSLCSKYDLHGDQCISVVELVRVFHVDLVKHHALELPFPLKEHETIQLAHPFIQRSEQDESPDGFISYQDLLDAILGPFQMNLTLRTNSAKQSKRALGWEFWHGIYMMLCGGNPLVEQQVLAQLGKILGKVDPDLSFMISTRHFKRIFERHICSDDKEVMVTVLATTGENSGGQLRYDVMLKLVFGSPELNDEPFFESHIRTKLLREQERIQVYISEIMAVHGAMHRLTLQDFYDTFVVQAEAYPLAMSAVLFLFALADSSHQGSVDVKALKTVLSMKCWNARKPGENSRVGEQRSGHDNTSTSIDVVSIKKLIVECCATYDLQSVLDDISCRMKGWVSQSILTKELAKMFHELGVVGVQQDDLKGFVQSLVLNRENTSKQTTNSPARDAVHCDAFFGALFDWGALVLAMKLPHSLVEIKMIFEKFDWDRIGIIRCEDWNKAYRLISRDKQGMTAWEIYVLQQRFPSHSEHRERGQTIDYERLLVYLLEYQQQQARRNLQNKVVEHFQQKFVSKHGRMSTAELERLFRELDADSKGYFNAADLKAYLTKEFTRGIGEDDAEACNSLELLSSADALAAVMRLLADVKGDRPQRTRSASCGAPTVVTFERFHEIVQSIGSGSAVSSPSPGSDSHKSRGAGQETTLHLRGRHMRELSRDQGKCLTISSLRVLEIMVLEIASEFVDMKGNILPTRAFRYLSQGPTLSAEGVKRTHPSSPVRRSTSFSSTNRVTGVSVTVRSKRRELEASTLDPLIPSKLKQLLQIYNHVGVSTHLISQFFLHIGSPSKYFLDLLHFSQWAAPLSVELQVKVRGVVRQMIVKGKGGGGRVDLDRFLAQLQRRLQDSPYHMTNAGSPENPPLQFVPMPLLLSKLHQLNIPLHKQELMTLLRHFGMEDDFDAVDYALFLQRLYELHSSSSVF